MPNSHGGTRPGAGRPFHRAGVHRVHVSLRMDPAYLAIIDYLAAQDEDSSRSTVVEQGLRRLVTTAMEPWHGPPLPPRRVEE